ncbi:hypothetical protein C0993_010250, partial [Termitomyces sp. T159_Od127]
MEVQGTRLTLFFLCSIWYVTSGTSWAYWQYWLRQIWEDPYSLTAKNFPCRVDRITGSLSVDDHANMINHNLNTNIIQIGKGILFSDLLDVPMTNGVES